jgi:glycosyltransferase involved in cell wall biosynthesis
MHRIAVITRTKDRPLLLSRCLDSLARQTYKDFLWVVVNDNGAIDKVEAVVTKAREIGIDT